MKSRVLAIILLVSGSLYAQYPTQLIVLKDVPQARYYDAGYFPKYSSNFGIPVLSNITVTASSSGFAMKDFFETKNRIGFSGLIAGLENKNYLNVGTGIDLFTLGFKIKKNYFSFNVTPKVDFNLGYNKNLFKFLIEGNGGFVGQTISFDGTGFDISAYNEFGLGFSREINEKLSVGGRLKVLLGIANLSGDFDEVSLHTANDDFEITASSTFSINQYGNHLMNDSLADAWGAAAVNPSNLGFGVDFGGSYNLSEKLNVFASVIDLGYLSWKDYGQRSYNDGASFSFGGVPYSSSSSSDSSQEESSYFEELSDSLQNVFSLKEERVSYTTALKTKVFIGANYKLNKYFDADAVAYGRFFGKKFYPSLMLGVGANLGSWFRLKLSYAATNKSYDNFGAGVVLNLGAFQIYTAVDNLYGLTQVDYAKNLSGSFGINFVIGKNSDKEKNEIKKREADSKPLINTDKPKSDSTVAIPVTVPQLIDTNVQSKESQDSSNEVVNDSIEKNSVVVPVLNDTASMSIDSSAAGKNEIKEVIEEKVVEEVVEKEIVPVVNKNKETVKKNTTAESSVANKVDSMIAPVIESASLSLDSIVPGIEKENSLSIPVKDVNVSDEIKRVDSVKTNLFLVE